MLSRLDQHVRNFFGGHTITEHIFAKGPTKQLIPDFKVLCSHPSGDFNFYTYLSIGCSLIEHKDGRRLEFLATSPSYDEVWTELLTMVAYYHSTEWLELGHTFPVGHRLLRDSTCDHMLVSLPYPFGPDLEVCCLDDLHVHFLWLLPITASEKRFRHEHGLEALEEKFDAQEIDYLDMQRPPVVHDAAK
jgi:hypothetical protein